MLFILLSKYIIIIVDVVVAYPFEAATHFCLEEKLVSLINVTVPVVFQSPA